ncbi:hypothetical protein LINPERHAP2_LOCUS2611 [Linum perenne]
MINECQKVTRVVSYGR